LFCLIFLTMKNSDFEKELRKLLQSLRLRVVISTKNQTIEKEIIQPNISESLQYKEKTTAENNLKSWIFTIMRDAFINEYKRIMKVSTTSWDKQSKILYYVKRPDEIYDINLVIDSLCNLPPEEYTIFSLYLKNYSYQEISEELQIPVYIIQNKIRNIQRQLKKTPM
ncbi:MAG: hypothetical protein KH153_05760, partial [Bacteroidales bacterium]|nr:hypothetical protein [Bacteroidales bacterium]